MTIQWIYSENHDETTRVKQRTEKKEALAPRSVKRLTAFNGKAENSHRDQEPDFSN